MHTFIWGLHACSWCKCMWSRAEKEFWPWSHVGSKIIVRIKVAKTAFLQRKSIHLFLPLVSSAPPTSLSSCAELLLQHLGFKVGGNFPVDTVLLRKYHFTEFKASYESAGTILWKCALPEEEFSQHQDQTLQLEESSTSRMACIG